MTTILITGASRGIGLEFVRQYSRVGLSLIATARDLAKAAELAKFEKASGGNIRVLPLNVGHAHSIAQLKKTLGDEPIDILINNAGIAGPRGETPETINADAWLEVFRTNSIAPLQVAYAFHDNLKGGKEKKLVTITSVLGSTAGNSGGMQPYRASKAAVNNFMHGLSREWAADGISVGIFHPGWVRTDMGGAGAAVSVEDSVNGLRQRITELNPKLSGTYRDYANTEIPW